MPTYLITAPDGRKFNVTGPGTAEEALAHIQQQAGGGGQSGPDFGQATEAPNDAGVQAAYDRTQPQRGSIIDPLSQGLLVGLPDEIQGVGGGIKSLMSGRGFQAGYDNQTQSARGDLAAYQERHPVVSTAAEIAGSLPTAMLPIGAAAKGASLAGKVGRGLVAGGVSGAAYGAGQGVGLEDRANNALISGGVGAVTGGAIPFAGRAIGKAMGGLVGRDAVPTGQAIKDQAQSLYKIAEQSGVSIKPASFADAVDQILVDAQKAGINPKQQPKAFENFKLLVKARDAGDKGLKINLSDMEQLRQIVGHVLKDPDPNERRVTHVIVDGLDNFMGGLKPTDVVGGNGNAKAAVDTIKAARELWTRKSKSDLIETAFERAKNQVGANYTSAGMETALRQQFKAIANKPNVFRKFSNQERAAIIKVVRGGRVENALRFIGKFAPTGYLTGAGAVGVGAAAGVVPAAIGAGGALAARHVATRMARKSANRADTLIRNGGVVPFDPNAARFVEDRTNKLLGVGGRVVVPQLTK